MSAWDAVRIVAAREIRDRVRSRAFLVSMVIVLLVVAVALVVVPLTAGGAGMSDRRFTLGVVGTPTAPAADALASLGEEAGGQVRLRPFGDLEEAEGALRREEVDLVVADGREILLRRPSARTASLVDATSEALRIAAAAAEADDPHDALRRGLREDAVTVRVLDPFDRERVGRLAPGAVGAFILFLLVATTSGLILTGVVEEKNSRVVELMVSATGAPTLLAGKVLGVAVLGLAQLVVMLAPAVVAGARAAAAGLVPPGWGVVLALLVPWFLLGYAFYAFVLAAAGSLVSRMEDLQYTAMPLMIALFASFYAIIPAIGEPSGAAAVVLSFVPPTAPAVMLVRIAAGAAPWWQVTLALAVMVLATALAARLAARIYSVGILHRGRRLKLREALRTSEA